MTAIVVSGHLVDAPGRATERFPARLVPAVTDRIAAAFDGGRSARTRGFSAVARAAPT